jgi:hypothetical protein
MIESTIIRALQHAVSALMPSDQDQGFGRSRGGLSTNHLRSNAIGLPLAVTLSDVQVSIVKRYSPPSWTSLGPRPASYSLTRDATPI